MSKIRSNQSGFSIVEAALILVLVACIGAAGFMVYRNHNKTAKNNSTAANTVKSDTSSKTATASDPYAGWKTYTSSTEGFSIKYPADWALKTGATNESGVFDPTLDAATITGPHDFTLSYTINKPASSFTCANCSFTLLDTIKLKNNQPGYIVVNSNTYNGNIQEQQISISKVKTYKEQSDQGFPYYEAFATPGKFVRWSGGYPGYDKTNCGGGSCEPVSIGLSEFMSKSEVKTAEKILLSLSY